MEIFDVLPAIGFLVFIVSAVLFLSIIWVIVRFATNILNAQNERNIILKEISGQLRDVVVSKKEE